MKIIAGRQQQRISPKWSEQIIKDQDAREKDQKMQGVKIHKRVSSFAHNAMFPRKRVKHIWLGYALSLYYFNIYNSSNHF
jgi:hypothetical protein